MAPVIHLVRHAQGYHNLTIANQWLRDPDLTELGKKQCEELCKNFSHHDKITHLVASPLRRTIFTCQIAFAPAVRDGKKIVALPDAQEISLFPCDVGRDVEELEAEFDDLVDLQFVPSGWNDKSADSKYYPLPEKLEARARDARIWLRNLVREAGDDAQVTLVTHGGILHFLTEDWSGISPGRGTGWNNTECRSYEFADSTGQDPNASLVELRESRRRREGSGIPYTETEKMEMRAAYEAVLVRDLEACLAEITRRRQDDDGAAGDDDDGTK